MKDRGADFQSAFPWKRQTAVRYVFRERFLGTPNFFLAYLSKTKNRVHTEGAENTKKTTRTSIAT